MTNVLRFAMAGLLSLGLVGLVSSANATVVIGGTRVVYPAQESEMTVKLSNEGGRSALVQVWLDTGDSSQSPSDIKVPFVLTPPVFRLDPGKGQTIRLRYTHEALPKDKESLFWFNVLEVPPKETGKVNTLELAIRTRIKLLFRPQGLPGTASEAPPKTRWQLVPGKDGHGYALKASNPTSYYVNLGKVVLTAGGKTFDAGQGYVAPGRDELFPVKGLDAPASGAEVVYTSIDDYGQGVEGKQFVQ